MRKETRLLITLVSIPGRQTSNYEEKFQKVNDSNCFWNNVMSEDQFQLFSIENYLVIMTALRLPSRWNANKALLLTNLFIG